MVKVACLDAQIREDCHKKGRSPQIEFIIVDDRSKTPNFIFYEYVYPDLKSYHDA
jgi:hypothetical protein